MAMIIDPPKNTSVMRLGTTLKKTILQPFFGQQILVTSQNKKCAALMANITCNLFDIVFEYSCVTEYEYYITSDDIQIL